MITERHQGDLVLLVHATIQSQEISTHSHHTLVLSGSRSFLISFTWICFVLRKKETDKSFLG